MRVLLMSLLALLLSTTSYAKQNYFTNPVVVVPGVVQVPAAASGHWLTSEVIGFELQLVVGKYYVEQGWGAATCGSVMRVDAAVPKTVPNESVHGRVKYFDPYAGAIPTGVAFNMIKVYRPGLVGVFTFNGYDAATDTISVTFTSSGGPNGTFTMYRDPMLPKFIPLNPC